MEAPDGAVTPEPASADADLVAWLRDLDHDSVYNQSGSLIEDDADLSDIVDFSPAHHLEHPAPGTEATDESPCLSLDNSHFSIEDNLFPQLVL